MAAFADFGEVEESSRQICNIAECFAYRITSRATSTGHKAEDWKMNQIWFGRMQIMAKGKDCVINLVEPNGDVFASCPQKYGGTETVEKVTDSTRYFVLRIEQPGTGKHGYIGIGFQTRDDAYDFKVALQDHGKQIKVEEESDAPLPDLGPSKDYSLKEGQTIKVNIAGGAGGGGAKKSSRSKRSTGSGVGGVTAGVGGLGLSAPPSTGRVRGPRAAPTRRRPGQQPAGGSGGSGGASGGTSGGGGGGGGGLLDLS